MQPTNYSSTESSQGPLNIGQHFYSRNMNLNNFITKVTLCSVMRIDRSDDRKSEFVYFGLHKLVDLMRGEQRFFLV